MKLSCFGKSAEYVRLWLMSLEGRLTGLLGLLALAGLGAQIAMPENRMVGFVLLLISAFGFLVVVSGECAGILKRVNNRVLSFLLVVGICAFVGALLGAVLWVAYPQPKTVAQPASTPAGPVAASEPAKTPSNLESNAKPKGAAQAVPGNQHAVIGPQPNVQKPIVTKPIDAAGGAPAPSDSESILSAANMAAEHYKKTSPTLKREEIRKEYAVICDRVAKTFGFGGWGPKNTITRMIDLNWADMEPFERAEKELPNSALVAVRTLVAFETEKERPMHMAYVFIGRAASGDEVVAAFDETKAWNILSVNASNYEGVMKNAIQKDLDRLTKLIALDIAKIK